MKVQAIVTGERQAADHLGDLGERARDARPALNKIADQIQRDQASNFASQGGKFGGWKPLAAATVAKKGHSRPLVASGALERALTTPGRGKGRVRRVSKTQTRVGTSIFYARFHQAQGRKVVGVTTTRAKVAARLVERYIVKGFV